MKENNDKKKPTQEEMASKISGLPIEKKEKIKPEEVFRQLDGKGSNKRTSTQTKQDYEDLFNHLNNESGNNSPIGNVFGNDVFKKLLSKDFKDFASETQKFCQYIGYGSKDDKDLMVRICTAATALINPLPLKTRLEVLEKIAMVLLSGSPDELLDMIKRLKDKKGDNFGL